MNKINLVDLFSPGVRMICSWSAMHLADTVATDKYSLAGSDIFCNYSRAVVFSAVYFKWNKMVTNNSNSLALITEQF
jgi:hypothetical protein